MSIRGPYQGTQESIWQRGKDVSQCMERGKEGRCQKEREKNLVTRGQREREREREITYQVFHGSSCFL